MNRARDSLATLSPAVGVGCVVMRGGRVLLVRNQGGYWSTPGGHLDFGESPAECAARETFEETGIRVSGVEFVAVTNDVLRQRERHYVTIWMRGEPQAGEIEIHDDAEIEEAGWFDPGALPTPLHSYFDNLVSGRSLPPHPPKLLFANPASGEEPS